MNRWMDMPRRESEDEAMKQTSQYQTIKQEGILLNANESSVNLPLSIREEIAQAIQETAFNRYPQDDYTALREAYAGYLACSQNKSLPETDQMKCWD